MIKPEWGTKRTCPACGSRFYDLQEDNPCVCIHCGHEWIPEPILKTRQPILVADEEKKTERKDGDDMELDDDVDLDDEDDNVLSETSLDDGDNEEVAAMVDTSLSEDD